uniref:Sushi domain-containing protein n=1 Tax=Macrostomum lignano TaxID=282301 RepID=A0A1I8GTN5_9PLAT
MEVGESVKVACKNASNPFLYYLRPIINIKCLLFANYSYEFGISFADSGSNNPETRTGGNFSVFLADLQERCVNQALKTCAVTPDMLSYRNVIVTNNSEVGWPHPRHHDNHLPPNSTLTIACNATRVQDRSSASVNRSYYLLCRPDGEVQVFYKETLGYESDLEITCQYETCPAFATPPRTEVTGVLEAANASTGANWTRDASATAAVTMATVELPPGYQLLIQCSLVPDAYQTVVCNDTGRVWIPLAASDNRSLWQSSELLNCTGM